MSKKKEPQSVQAETTQPENKKFARFMLKFDESDKDYPLADRNYSGTLEAVEGGSELGDVSILINPELDSLKAFLVLDRVTHWVKECLSGELTGLAQLRAELKREKLRAETLTKAEAVLKDAGIDPYLVLDMPREIDDDLPF